MQQLLNQFLDWLERTIPTALLFFKAGYGLGQDGVSKLKSALAWANWQLKRKEDRDAVEKLNSGKSDSDIIDDAIKSERDSEIPKS